MTDCLRIFLPPLQNFVNTVYHISFLIQAQRGALISERLASYQDTSLSCVCDTTIQQ